MKWLKSLLKELFKKKEVIRIPEEYKGKLVLIELLEKEYVWPFPLEQKILIRVCISWDDSNLTTTYADGGKKVVPLSKILKIALVEKRKAKDLMVEWFKSYSKIFGSYSGEVRKMVDEMPYISGDFEKNPLSMSKVMNRMLLILERKFYNDNKNSINALRKLGCSPW